MDGVGLDDPLGPADGAGDMGVDAHGGEHGGEALDPRGFLPARVGEQEVESAVGREVFGMGR